MGPFPSHYSLRSIHWWIDEVFYSKYVASISRIRPRSPSSLLPPKHPLLVTITCISSYSASFHHPSIRDVDASSPMLLSLEGYHSPNSTYRDWQLRRISRYSYGPAEEARCKTRYSPTSGSNVSGRKRVYT